MIWITRKKKLLKRILSNITSKISLELFQQMRLTWESPTSDTFACIIIACANLAYLGHCKKIHNDIIKTGIEALLFVGNALVDMYGKCGSIEDALNVFDKMPHPDAVSWTEMIFGYAMHRYGREALQSFEQMQSSGTKPGQVTFIASLSSWLHAVLLDDSLHCFNSLSRKYHLTPVMEHYCCVVDLLGCVGCLACLLDDGLHCFNSMRRKYHITPVMEQYCCVVDLLGRAGVLMKHTTSSTKFQ